MGVRVFSRSGRLRREEAGGVSDRLFQGLTALLALMAFLLLVGIMVSLLVGGWPALRHFGADFLVSRAWNPVTAHFGGLVPIAGTLITSAIALLVGVPVSFGIAIFLTELSPLWLRRPLGTAIELLAAIPSIIYGMWGLFIFAPFFADTIQPWVSDHVGPLPLIGKLVQGPPMGIGLFTAGLILSIMIIPYIAAVMRDVFELVPKVLKESAYGLGATTWEVVRGIVIPYTRVGIVGGVMLGLGRALGETMAVTFVIGNAHQLSPSLFMPGNSIASLLANEFTEATGQLYLSSLVLLGAILFGITFIVLACARLLLLRLERLEGGRS